MPRDNPSPQQQTELDRFLVNAIVFGPIRPSAELHRRTQRALKGHVSGRDYFTEITLHVVQSGGMRVEYTVAARSPEGAQRVGMVYLAQLCDLLSSITRVPVRFYLPGDDSRDERIRQQRQSTTVDRFLSDAEWSWITGSLVFLRREHPRFLAAASWYRKGLLGNDSLDVFCCFWRVIERLALSYADKSAWSDEERSKSSAKKCVTQLVSDLFVDEPPPDVLTGADSIGRILKLRNDLSHGNVPITLEIIEEANWFAEPLEAAAFSVLKSIRHSVINDEHL